MYTMKQLNLFLEQKKLENTKLMTEKLGKVANYKPNNYEILFQNMGVIDLAEGHRVKHLKTKDYDCFKDITFKLSDNLSASKFVKHLEHIKEKIYSSNLQIISKDGNMTFRIVKDDLPSVIYKIQKLQNNLLPLGVDLQNSLITSNLTTDPNMIVAGVPGCGKSSLLNMIITYIMENKLGKLYLVDLKAGIEFGMYENCKCVQSYSEEIEDSYTTINMFKKEMNRRFKLLKKAGYKKYEDYIQNVEYIDRYFLIIDEFADLMPNKKIKADDYDVCRELTDLGRKARATGGHMILSTQRPNRDSLPPNLKAVCSCVVGFRTSNNVNSKIVIDEGGLEDLENRHFITISCGKKMYGRTMFLKEELLKSTINKHTIKKTNVTQFKPKEARWVDY